MVRVRPVPWASSPPSHPYSVALPGTAHTAPAPLYDSTPSEEGRGSPYQAQDRQSCTVMGEPPLTEVYTVLATQRFIQFFYFLKCLTCLKLPRRLQHQLPSVIQPGYIFELFIFIMFGAILIISLFFIFSPPSGSSTGLPSVIQPRRPSGSSTGCPV